MEAKVAHEYDKAKSGHILPDSDLVKMVTINALGQAQAGLVESH